MDARMNQTTVFSTIMCNIRDDLGYDVIPMYRVLFGISCASVPLGILLNIIFVSTFVLRANKIVNVRNHALLLSCLVQATLSFVQNPIRTYFYYNHGCSPRPGSFLCEVTVYLDYIPTQINNFLVVQISIERFFIMLKPFMFHRIRRRNSSVAIWLHYCGLILAIAFPCIYYPVVMHYGAATIDLEDPSQTQTCDLWYARAIYENFDLLITIVPYSLILVSCLGLIATNFYRKCVCAVQGDQRRLRISRNQRRFLFAIHLFLIWFLITWSPWVLYDFFQTTLNLTYSVYIDAIMTFIIYVNYTFSPTIVLLTFREFRPRAVGKIGIAPLVLRMPNQPAPAATIQCPTEGNRFGAMSSN